MATIKKFEDLDSWKLAKELCEKVGKLIDDGKFKKNYRLIDQIEGSSGSIMDNIAEGFERGIRGEFITFLGYAKGSAGELRSQLYRVFNRKYISAKECDELFQLSTTISGKLQRLIEYPGKTPIKGTRKK